MVLYLKLFGAFFTALIVVLVTTPYIITLARKVGAIDMPDSRRINKIPIPRMGGVAIISGFWLATFLFGEFSREMGGLFLGCTIIVLLGIIDDIRGLPPSIKLAGQFVAAAVVVGYGYRVPWVRNPLGEGYWYFDQWTIPLTMLWIVGITNAVNLIDGLDGLAAGTAAIAALTLLIVGVNQGSATLVVFMASLAGSCLAFLKFNFNPAKIFMGDSGALSLGFLLATISIQSLTKSATTIALVVPFLALGLPIIDTLSSIVRRMRQGKAPWVADRGHLHHRLLDDYGCNQRQAATILYTFNIVLGVTAVMWARSPGQSALIASGIFALCASGGILALLRQISINSKREANETLH